MNMNNEEKRKLDQMIAQNNTVDNTSNIRKERKSKQIRDCVAKIQNIKRKHHNTRDFKVLDAEAMKSCGYLFTNFPNIYNKLLKYQIDVKILYQFLDELERVENGELNQHEASFVIGNILKEMYIDPRIDSEGNMKPTQKKESKKIKERNSNKVKSLSWADFKKMQNKSDE